MIVYKIASSAMVLVGVVFLFVLTWQWALAMFGAAVAMYFIGLSITENADGSDGDA